MKWETVIGLEIHAQLATRTKIFSGAPTAYGAEPNTQACPVDLGMPGVLPVLNREVVRMAIKFGLAVGARIAPRSVFARKNYFYPDLPKGYQISQYDLPIVEGGQLDIELEDGVGKRIGITRAHLEEDAGKSLHEDFHGMTGVDLNRAGTPLMEIVSEPDLRSPAEAAAYMKKLHALVRYLEICDGNMQEGSFRCDANVSVRPAGQQAFGTRAELKNLNSFRFVERALEYEVERQIDLLESGGEVVQETRLYDVDKGVTRSMRTKEEANDYRYFPEPDLLPVEVDSALVEEVRETLPELPDEKRRRFEEEYGLPAYDAGVLTATRDMADYFEHAVSESGGFAKRTANLLMSELLAYLNKDGREIGDSPVTPEMLGKLVARVEDETLSSRGAKDVFEAMWAGEGEPDEVIESKGLKQVTDTSAIEALVDEAIANNPKQLEQYRAGKEKLFGFFVGQVMKASGGKANPQQVNELLKRKLDGS
ncbi:MAG: Asp-tRNA(Asn)/Glu-tRNA(Gln) amidotransferase subunit GatB [Halorhodospira halophila]|uniref:Asp-tRNA(Asn)/Glu-tRNA(Gln) amidotransferase subunit GatB n=1 Tax=Halorhodospira TaxID=85108 RepID=UPI001911ABF0|nr:MULTISPECIES: Asp-tRNA(Asn)/Glu-tRNA(Gln) amidotransferase subunit GatB [Halorhodospira]MBK5935976.1 aspartyl/glutamyl-tRNA amidotransferase subunit B [Halorhodospira halophila]MBK5943380.1 aspartyl/glutamyl-tRNA amidotransferase subunit B [Halorhodospira halophila]MCC3751046.1 Asp-tRNA(Asn)/Glu-tRNA(Gln) amidotransferase subunit GatB [Halorhodospira halophila]MCG5526910.1 Asp-tRNA(Asn)/Glu-tRNA(Gln) amidotransferase subunit GatB [Halorhodospira halophila]MCG5533168.1 Asp-tRNA(Asn)/Glu-tRNA